MRRIRSFPLILSFILLFLSNTARGQQWSGLLAPNRAVNWSNAGAGAIPARTGICQTLGAAGQSPSYAQSVTAAQIVSALQSCAGSNQVVYLNPGTYTMTQTLFGGGVAAPSNVTLRGAGANQTILAWTAYSNNCLGAGAPGVAFCVTNGDSGEANYSQNVFNWTGGYSQGSTSLTLGSAVSGSLSSLRVGSLLTVNQLDPVSDTGNKWICGVQPTATTAGCTWGGRSTAWPGRGQAQTVMVTGVSGSTVTISPGLYDPDWSSAQAPYAFFSVFAPVTGFGIESLQVNTQQMGDIEAMVQTVWATNSWFKDVAFVNADAPGAAARKHLMVTGSTHITVRDSYFYGGSPTSDGYGVDFAYQSSDNLAENNIFQHIATGTILEDGIGNVFGYNYAVDNFYTNGDPNWQQCDAFHHDEGDAYNLWEGHEGICAANDDMHGTSFAMTLFRNYFNGHDPATQCPPGESSCGTANKLQFTMAIMDMGYQRYMNIIGNVLGTAGYHNTYQNVGAAEGTGPCPGVPWTVIYSFNYADQNQLAWTTGAGCYWDTSTMAYPLDNDPLTSQTAVRWGNYDVVNGSVQTNSSETGSSASTYPGLSSPSTSWSSYPSFYLSSKPAFWGSMPWPAVGPDVTGGNIANVGGHAYHNPAGNCYLNVLGGHVDGSSGVLNFDASACYPTSVSAAGGPPPPVNLTGTVVQ